MTNPRGRPRAFDPDAALQAAMLVFWKNGYEGASMNDLVDATGMNKPSLYAAFGDKEALFLKALARYGERVATAQSELLESEPEIRTALELLMRRSAASLTDPALPGGCLVVTGIADCGTGGMPSLPESALREALSASESVIFRRLDRARREGALPDGLDPGATASMVASFMAGMGVQAKAGATRAKLETGIDAMLGLWPAAGSPTPRVRRAKA